MGIRLELLLMVAIVFTVMITNSVNLSNGSHEVGILTKELEFFNSTFIEVDKKSMQARSFSTYGVRDAGILTLNNLMYHTNNIELLLANKGTYKNNTLYLDGNVSLEQKDGFHYTAEHAIYNQKTEMLHITSTFKATMDQNIIIGENLQYNAVKNELNASVVDAIVYTAKK